MGNLGDGSGCRSREWWWWWTRTPRTSLANSWLGVLRWNGVLRCWRSSAEVMSRTRGVRLPEMAVVLPRHDSEVVFREVRHQLGKLRLEVGEIVGDGRRVGPKRLLSGCGCGCRGWSGSGNRRRRSSKGWRREWSRVSEILREIIWIGGEMAPNTQSSRRLRPRRVVESLIVLALQHTISSQIISHNIQSTECGLVVGSVVLGSGRVVGEVVGIIVVPDRLERWVVESFVLRSGRVVGEVVGIIVLLDGKESAVS